MITTRERKEKGIKKTNAMLKVVVKQQATGRIRGIGSNEEEKGINEIVIIVGAHLIRRGRYGLPCAPSIRSYPTEYGCLVPADACIRRQRLLGRIHRRGCEPSGINKRGCHI